MTEMAAKRADFQRQALVHMDAMYAYALRLCNNPRNAEDLVQDAVLRAYRHWDQFESNTNCKAWLLKILSNLYFGEYKHRVRQREVMQQLSAEQTATRQVVIDEEREGQRSPQDVMLDASVSDEVIRALRTVPADFRAAVLLCDMQGLSYQETADALGCPTGTVMSRLFRGRKLLRAALANYASHYGYGNAVAEANEIDDKVVSLQQYRQAKGGTR